MLDKSTVQTNLCGPLLGAFPRRGRGKGGGAWVFSLRRLPNIDFNGCNRFGLSRAVRRQNQKGCKARSKLMSCVLLFSFFLPLSLITRNPTIVRVPSVMYVIYAAVSLKWPQVGFCQSYWQMVAILSLLGNQITNGSH